MGLMGNQLSGRRVVDEDGAAGEGGRKGRGRNVPTALGVHVLKSFLL